MQFGMAPKKSSKMKQIDYTRFYGACLGCFMSKKLLQSQFRGKFGKDSHSWADDNFGWQTQVNINEMIRAAAKDHVLGDEEG